MEGGAYGAEERVRDHSLDIMREWEQVGKKELMLREGKCCMIEVEEIGSESFGLLSLCYLVFFFFKQKTAYEIHQ